ncbi:DUF2789 domain-containing protein [Colwellia sp. MB02u-18]|uniref:DUF2789 domain-containing protein n=1 Tax=unclassified Colwellia TaxID=196834 RepID=UPI0015F5A023|nr:MULTISPECIES: DUF2789 domain-containing protein [unclassified Colwellia]MBA6225048.1 DUF2789 domain-containing protein [Colwellia sp. MB3u-45]MBA6268664.1 DUF2789 domain-containing protein [Colwellia sp. MB3u-43]MBA6296408.1 DUF2789 domain-containing protein [Colwellia sp. MB02u-9]MBA6321095.1 DUF2789 domain-containing protein [Colwellia sp. MB02u-19]MBA6325648.1 DUF2789 domain-containing protein [Colwellia sp. MB02u-18]
MDLSKHNMTSLFAQLGLKNSDEEIERFIASNRGIPVNQALADADFWSNGQAQFLQEAIVLDSDWSEVVDSLDALLRS